ncbi:cilia- and flagella-associated protein 161 isoform X1 [Epinephelus fuscoguttatus]|uniref:cilia- and flagella-associated protein 161 isoform X1 n=1 Tax=Epinephelus fuscoguttatus TaxID=293821 RepID=UPI0020CFEA0C|nr:cilia- and flagella-associated protein 161 isoform X1 [Epinephelus fuscoguttatus]
MAHVNTYRTNVRIGNWNEDLYLEEDKKKEYLEKKERGELSAQKVDFLKQNILRPVDLTVTNDGQLHFGDVVMLVNMGGEKRQCSALSINADINSLTKTPSLAIQAPCGVSAGRGIQACTRTAFIITSVDGSQEGSTLHYEQSFALKTTSGFAGGLFLTSDLQSFQKCAKKSRLQEVNLDHGGSFLSWWKIVHFDPQERLEYEGQPIPANVSVLIIHCKTNQALAVLGTCMTKSMRLRHTPSWTPTKLSRTATTGYCAPLTLQGKGSYFSTTHSQPPTARSSRRQTLASKSHNPL